MTDTRPPSLSTVSPSPHVPPVIKPRFGRLLAVCGLAVVFCGVLVWLMVEHFDECCDLSWLGRWVH